MPAEKDPAPFAVDDFVIVFRGHSEGASKTVGRVVEVIKYGGLWRVIVETKKGKLNLDYRVVHPFDPIEGLAMIE